MSDLYSDITAPLSASDPFGADVNYDADYERLKSEMGKLGDIDAALVYKLSRKILTEKSKDIRAFAFLAYSVLRGGEVKKLADVFCALAEYCERDMASLYPKRDGAKIAALGWFAESRFFGQCEKLQVSADDLEDTERLAGAFAKLRGALDAYFSDSAPPLSSLYRIAAEWNKAAKRASSFAVKKEIGGIAKKITDDRIDQNDVTAENAMSDPNYTSVNVKHTDTESNMILAEILNCLKRIEKLLEDKPS